MKIPEELNRVVEIKEEYLKEIYGTPTSPYYRNFNLRAGGKSWEETRPQLPNEIAEAANLFDELKMNGKIIRGYGVHKRKFQHYYLGVSEGTIEKINIGDNKKSNEPDNSSKQTEKEYVCKGLINPLLKKLGYQEKDYKYNEAIHMGSSIGTNQNCKPDYRVLLSETKRGIDYVDKTYLNTAQIVIEAKYELGDADGKWYGQAVTYARRLCAPYIILADRYNFVLYHSEDNFIKYKPPILKCSWEELEDKDKFAELKKYIHKKHFKRDEGSPNFIRKNNV